MDVVGLPRERFAECGHTIKFLAIAQSPPFGVIAILFAPFDVPPGGLQVAARVGADPDLLVSGRNREARDAIELGSVGE